MVDKPYLGLSSCGLRSVSGQDPRDVRPDPIFPSHHPCCAEDCPHPENRQGGHHLRKPNGRTHTPVVRVVSVFSQPPGRSPLATWVTHGVANDGTCFLLASDLRVLGKPPAVHPGTKGSGICGVDQQRSRTLSSHRVDMLEEA